MTSHPDITARPTDRGSELVARHKILSLVAVSSEPADRAGNRAFHEPSAAVTFPLKASATEKRRVSYRRIEAQLVGRSAAWLRHRNGKVGVHVAAAGAIGAAPTGISSLPGDTSGIADLFERDEAPRLERRAVAAAIIALREADAVIAGPLSSDDVNATGMLPHLANLARNAYRALRPPRELLVHPGFAQVARQFHFIQMSHNEARALGAGAVDLGILAHRLRQLQGQQGEFALTRFSGNGVIWAEGRLWEIDPIADGELDEKRAATAFCAAWVVARRFLNAPVANALPYARSAAIAAIRAAR